MKKIIAICLLGTVVCLSASCRETKSDEEKTENDVERVADEVEDGIDRAAEEVEGAFDDVKEEVDGETDDN